MINSKKCWIDIAKDSDFSIFNIPFGIFSSTQKSKRLGAAIGSQILDLEAAYHSGVFDSFKTEEQFKSEIFKNSYLNDFISLGKKVTSEFRIKIQEELCNPESKINDPIFFEPINEVQMHIPVQIGDYTDFYSSIEHATNVGCLFRDPKNALLPNWKHMPVAYHGRSSSIIGTGVPIHRPKGQMKIATMDKPIFGPSVRLDFELEMGYIIGAKSSLGESISSEEAEDYIFGKVIFNDWSARDIQQWEYVPLGPFLGKNFASSISPWVVTMEALEPFRTSGPTQDTAVLPYLEVSGPRNFDITLEVSIQPQDSIETTISNSNFKFMYWNMAQQIAHHTINGCNLNVGDLFASGTISGSKKESYGSLLEISQAGKTPLKLETGHNRSFIEDYDTIRMRAYCIKDNKRVGFGGVSTQILPAF
tara:strand:- start:805 stop:2061 length:1257 start_codon:yes stop_codon:yes gene_type:complete